MLIHLDSKPNPKVKFFPKPEKTALDRGRTDRINLTHDLDLQSPAIYDHDLLTCQSSRSTVNRFRRVETNGRTDGGECITCRANAVGYLIL